MRLWHDSFMKIMAGSKTIEMRLFDEKRSRISAGDTIEFEDNSTGDLLVCTVLGLYRYSSFAQLYARHDKISIGYDENENADPEDMRAYYSKEDEEKYGVVGIKIRKI